MRVLRALHRAIAFESTNGRAAEIAAWSNALASIGVGVGAFFLFGSWIAAAVAMPVFFAVLRFALVHRKTLWLAGALGIGAVAGTGGGLGWLFGHLSDARIVPPIACALAAILTGLVPAWAYAQLATVRETRRDSLIDVPSSRL